MSQFLSDTPTQPWKIVDPQYRLQQLITHVGTPVLALLFTVVSPMAGFTGFCVTWLGFHLISAALLAKYGKKKKSYANAFLEVFVGATIFVLLKLVCLFILCNQRIWFIVILLFNENDCYYLWQHVLFPDKM